MNNFRELVLFMLNKMDDDFKKQYTVTIVQELQKYSCLNLMKEDLIGYLEDEYINNPDYGLKQKIITCINDLDDEDMQNMANDFPNDCVMDSFWYFIEDQLDQIKERLDNSNG